MKSKCKDTEGSADPADPLRIKDYSLSVECIMKMLSSSSSHFPVCNVVAPGSFIKGRNEVNTRFDHTIEHRHLDHTSYRRNFGTVDMDV